MEEIKVPKLYELHCPLCGKAVGVMGERTETFSQTVAWCKTCRAEFTMHYFKVIIGRKELKT